MAKILYTWEIGNGLAYAEGPAAAALPFRAAGHEVAFAFRDLSHAERLFHGEFKVFQAPTPVRDLPGPVVPITFADLLHNSGYGNAKTQLGRLRAWRDLLESYQPDILRCLHSPGALLAARGLPIKTVAVGTGFLVPPAVTPLRNLRPDAKIDAAALAAQEARVLDEMNKMLAALSAPKLDCIGQLYATDATELYTYPELDEYGSRPGADYLGIFQIAAGSAPSWPESKGKRILAYLDNFKLLPLVLQALKQSGHSVLVFLPRVPEELHKQFEGGNLAFSKGPLNLIETTRQCDLTVCHGGQQIVATTLLAGKPLLLLPLYLPEQLTTRNVEKLGAGLRALKPADIGAALARLVAEPGFTRQAQGFAQRYAKPMDLAKIVAQAMHELHKTGKARYPRFA